MPEIIIYDQNQTKGLLRLAFERIAGEGRVSPTIIAIVQMSTLVDEVRVIPFHMTAKLLLGSDIIAKGA